MFDLITIMYIVLIMLSVIIINTVLGALLAAKNDDFSLKKLLLGILKSIVVTICLFIFCISLELLSDILLKINIQIPDNMPTVIEVIFAILTVYKKYALDCFEKFKIILGGDEK